MDSTGNTAHESDGLARLTFAAIDRRMERTIVRPTERLQGDMVTWGDRNLYPEYLQGLVENVPTLQSIIDGNMDYIAGDDIRLIPVGGRPEGTVNQRGDLIGEQVRDIACDWETFGGFALQVIRGRDGSVSEIYYLDMRFLRTNKEADVFWYCEEWNKGGMRKAIRYPAFIPSLDWSRLDEAERERHISSVVYVRRTHRHVYPRPLYAAAIKACETERQIDEYHLSSISNGFFGSLLVNFNNGVPSEEIREEIEKDFSEKFGGATNAGRIMFSWNRSKETKTDLTVPQIVNYGDRYNTLASRTRQQIFTAFRANPNLFGIPTEGNGFSNEEYTESFELYNRTQIRPVQKIICDTYGMILGQPDAMSIEPFSMGNTATREVE